MKIENIDRATIVVKRINILSSYLEKLNHSGITAVKTGILSSYLEKLNHSGIMAVKTVILSSYLEKLNHSGITAVKPGSGITLILNNSDGTSLGAVVSEESRAAITNIVTDSLQRELEALEKELSTL